MPASSPEAQAEIMDRLDIGHLFQALGPGVAHPRWSSRMTREFTDPVACPLCRGGWCVQVLVVGGENGVIKHGLALH